MSTQWMNIIAVITGPVIAVIITLVYQRHRLQQDIRHNLFLTLMTHRKAIPPSAALINALNILDVVFHKNPTVLKLWHEYFEILCQPNPTPPMHELQKKKYLDLLSEIARSLKYKNLRQTDIDIFYAPQGQMDQLKMSLDIQGELLRVLQNTQSFLVLRKKDESTKTP